MKLIKLPKELIWLEEDKNFIELLEYIDKMAGSERAYSLAILDIDINCYIYKQLKDSFERKNQWKRIEILGRHAFYFEKCLTTEKAYELSNYIGLKLISAFAMGKGVEYHENTHTF